MIADMRAKLPDPSSFKVWGYDAGDFSGDGYADCAVSLQIFHEGGRRMHVYLFVDDEGVLKLVDTMTRPYLQLPIEVGINIRNGVCSIVSKRSDTRWEITSYAYRYGDVIVADSFVRDFTNPVAFERGRNFRSLRARDRYYNFQSDSTFFSSEYLVLPCYPRGHLPFPNIPFAVVDSTVDFVVSGSFYWTGRRDAGMATRTVHDDDYLYFLIQVFDSNVVTTSKDPMHNDHCDIWIDATPSHRVVRDTAGGTIRFRTRADSNIYDFTLFPGNFLEKKPTIKLASSQQFSEDQYSAMHQMKVVSRKTPDGYLLKVRIPFSVVGMDGPPVEGTLESIGCTITVTDIDNEYRPDEATVIATSNFNPKDPTSFGELMLIPQDKIYGTVLNVYMDGVAGRIGEIGF